MKSKKLLEQQVTALRYANGILRQTVPPEKQKFLPPITPETPAPPTVKDKFMKILPKIAIVLAVFVVIGAIAALIAVEIAVLSSKEKEEHFVEDLPEAIPYGENVSGLNAYFGGCAAEYGDRIYVLASIQNRLYYLDGAGNTKKVSRSEVSNLFAVDKYIYYVNGSTNVVEKANVHDGKIFTVGMAICTSALITDGKIYAIALEDGSLREYDSEGKTYTTLFSEKTKTVDVCGNTVYILTEENELYSLINSEAILLAENVHLSGLIGETLYFSDGKSLYRLTEGKAEDTGYTARDFNGNGDMLLLQNPERETELILQTAEASIILAADYYGGLTVTENYILYTSVDGYRYLICPDNGLERTLLQ